VSRIGGKGEKKKKEILCCRKEERILLEGAFGFAKVEEVYKVSHDGGVMAAGGAKKGPFSTQVKPGKINI